MEILKLYNCIFFKNPRDPKQCYCLWKILARDYSYIMYILERESEKKTDKQMTSGKMHKELVILVSSREGNWLAMRQLYEGNFSLNLLSILKFKMFSLQGGKKKPHINLKIIQ